MASLKMLINAIQKYAAKDLREAAHDADETGGYPPEIVRRGWELGILQASIPEAYGGFGDRSAVTGVLAAEELAWGDLAGALAVMAPATFALPTLAAGTEEQKNRWLPILSAASGVPGRGRHRAGLRLRPRPTANDRRAAKRRLLSTVRSARPFADTAEAFLVFASSTTGTSLLRASRVDGLTIGERKVLRTRLLPTHRFTWRGHGPSRRSARRRGRLRPGSGAGGRQYRRGGAGRRARTGGL
jgi:alkylation response protein AidB-like acyl-CoA dehydrogenase